MNLAEPEYRIPKRQVRAEVKLPGQAPRKIQLHLASQAEQHYGQERPSDLLNGTESFLPAVDQEGEIGFIPREAVMILSVPAEHEMETEGVASEGAARTERVEIIMEDGTRIQGDVTYVLPADQERLLDFLNTADRFFRVHDDLRVHLVNKHRMAWAAPAGD